MSVDVSILIVHTFEKALVRQTLRGIRRAAPTVSYEVIIIDNNPAAGMKEVLDQEFSEVKYLPLSCNKGFGAGMNEGIRVASGRYILIFNPDIIVSPGSLEELVKYMDTHGDVGVVGPQLLNPDGSLQYSCCRIPTVLFPVYRRTPVGLLPFAKRQVEQYLMLHDDHSETMEVDSMIGAALFCRADRLREIGMFDEQFFMYYEDNDLCRRFWEAGSKVVYHPGARMTHYHRRASADGNLFAQLFSRYTWIQMASFVKYALKYKGKPNPRILL
jgi:GT2 family glycosyltransferase